MNRCTPWPRVRMTIAQASACVLFRNRDHGHVHHRLINLSTSAFTRINRQDPDCVYKTIRSSTEHSTLPSNEYCFENRDGPTQASYLPLPITYLLVQFHQVLRWRSDSWNTPRIGRCFCSGKRRVSFHMLTCDSGWRPANVWTCLILQPKCTGFCNSEIIDSADPAAEWWRFERPLHSRI